MHSRIAALVFLFALFLKSAVGLSVGSEAVVLNTARPNDLSESMRVFEDPEGKITITDIMTYDWEQKFPADAAKNLNPGYSSSKFWVLIPLSNLSQNEEWFILPDYPVVNFEAYLVRPDGAFEKAKVRLSGERFATRYIQIPSGMKANLLIHAFSHINVNLQFSIFSEAKMYERLNEESQFVGIIAGIFLAMIIYNFVLLLTLRDSDHLYYLLFAIVNCHLNMMSVNYPDGIMHWFGIDWIPIVDFYRPLAPLTTIMFARSFLQTKKENPKLDKTLLAYNAGLVFFIFSALFLSRPVLNMIEDVYFLLGIILLAAAGILSLKRGFRPSHNYLLGLALFTLGIVIYILRSEGVIPTNGWTLNVHIALQAAEAVLISLALSAKIKQLQDSKGRAEVTATVKGRLLRVITHDISNPLSVVKASVYLLRNEDANVKRLDSITRAVGVIEEIIRFVHKTEALDNGNRVATDLVKVADVFESLTFIFQNLALDKQIALIFEQDHPEMLVIAEKTSLTYEVIGNFISNAIKFSSAGGTINVRLRSRIMASVSVKNP
jgi:signal transduction histidine kinase